MTALVRTLALVVFCLVAFSLSLRGTLSGSLPAAQARGVPISFGTNNRRVQGRVYQKELTKDHGTLVIVLHGDAPGRKPAYQYEFASRLSDLTGARVLALLRPGYADPFGGQSDGDRGLFAVGENYTYEVEGSLADAIVEAKRRFVASRVILIGHSGGAILAADIAALQPDLIQTAVLVSCPCDVVAFRRHMAVKQWNPLWLLPVRALSPLQTIAEMKGNTLIQAISGTEDDIALPIYASVYVAEAKRLGINAHLVSLPGKEHEILLDQEVINLIREEI